MESQAGVFEKQAKQLKGKKRVEFVKSKVARAFLVLLVIICLVLLIWSLINKFL